MPGTLSNPALAEGVTVRLVPGSQSGQNAIEFLRFNYLTRFRTSQSNRSGLRFSSLVESENHVYYLKNRTQTRQIQNYSPIGTLGPDDSPAAKTWTVVRSELENWIC